jgi:hypothetical protein
MELINHKNDKTYATTQHTSNKVTFLILVLYDFIVQNILSSLYTYVHVIELLCYNWRFVNLWLEIFYRRIWCVFLLFIDAFLLFVSVLNQLHPISIYIVYISELVGGDLPPGSSQRLTGMVVSSTPRLSGTWIRNIVVIGTDCTGSY